MKRLKPNELTIKQRKYVKEYVANGGNGTQAVLNSHDYKSTKAASVMSSTLLKKDKINKSIESILNRVGLDLESISSPLETIIHSPIKDVKPADTLRALDMAYKLHNAYPPSKNISARFSITKKYSQSLTL